MFSEKFRRTGAFVVDILIAKMFTQALLSGLVFLTYDFINSSEAKLSLNDDTALPVLLALVMSIMMTFIIIYMTYSLLCFRLIGRSLGKYLLSVPEPEHYSVKTYGSKEFRKIFLTVASLGLYPLYAGLQLYIYDRPPYHLQ